jgi:hypothetical protein
MQEQEHRSKKTNFGPYGGPGLPEPGDTIERKGRTWIVECLDGCQVTVHLQGRSNIVKFIPYWAWREMYPVKYEPSAGEQS